MLPTTALSILKFIFNKIERKPRLINGKAHYQAQLGLPEKARAIKGLVILEFWT